MIVLIVFIVVLETGQFHVVLAFYVSKTKFACRLNLAAKKKRQKYGKKSWFTLRPYPRKAQLP